MPYTYMVRCADSTLYTGWTTDVAARVQTHNRGKGAKYTKSRLPVTLVWSYYSESKNLALKLEAAVKKLPKNKKEQLITAPLLIETFCAKLLEAEYEK